MSLIWSARSQVRVQQIMSLCWPLLVGSEVLDLLLMVFRVLQRTVGLTLSRASNDTRFHRRERTAVTEGQKSVEDVLMCMGEMVTRL
jgi:hypothetical protein